MTNGVMQSTKFAYGLDELTELLGLGRSTLYLEVRAGRLRLSKVGRRSIVLADDLAAYLAVLKKGESASPSKPGPAGAGNSRSARPESEGAKEKVSIARS